MTAKTSTIAFGPAFRRLNLWVQSSSQPLVLTRSGAYGYRSSTRSALQVLCRDARHGVDAATVGAGSVGHSNR